MRFTAATDNPYCQHPLPLQEGSRLAAAGTLRFALLAFEAAAQVVQAETPSRVHVMLM